MNNEEQWTEEKLLTSREAADFLQIGQRTLQRYVAPRGPLKAVRFGQCLRFRRQDLREFIAQHCA